MERARAAARRAATLQTLAPPERKNCTRSADAGTPYAASG
jgi:hypothetical protein